MKYRPFGNTGLDVSAIGFGCWELGGNYGSFDETEVVDAIHRALDLGINCFDTAQGYGRGKSEALLARGLPHVRRGPDTWSLTIGEHPRAFTEDRLHPNERGAKIMAEAWYRAIAGHQAQEGIIEAMHARDYDVEAMTGEYLAWRAGGATG